LEELLRKPAKNSDSWLGRSLNLLEHTSTIAKLTVFGDGFTVSENALSPFTYLSNVQIEKRGNARPTIDQNAFSRLSRLSTLLLDSVQLPSDTSRMFNSALNTLTTLTVTNVDMRQHVNSFKECTKLERVTMTNCELTEFPMEMLRKSADSLRLIDLSKNKITTPLKADNIGQLKKLQTIDLSCNKISSVESTVFRPMNLISEINLEFNQIRSMTAAMFQPCLFLREIKLKGNPITGLRRNDINCEKFTVFTAPGGNEPIACGN
jgi:Leucine-rich repeat (LRR) protein